jgi:hypothetical protein
VGEQQWRAELVDRDEDAGSGRPEGDEREEGEHRVGGVHAGGRDDEAAGATAARDREQRAGRGDGTGDGGDVPDDCAGDRPDAGQPGDPTAREREGGVALRRDAVSADRVDQHRGPEQPREKRDEHSAGCQRRRRRHR